MLRAIAVAALASGNARRMSPPLVRGLAAHAHRLADLGPGGTSLASCHYRVAQLSLTASHRVRCFQCISENSLDVQGQPPRLSHPMYNPRCCTCTAMAAQHTQPATETAYASARPSPTGSPVRSRTVVAREDDAGVAADPKVRVPVISRGQLRLRLRRELVGASRRAGGLS
jgi:hypothetical protein